MTDVTGNKINIGDRVVMARQDGVLAFVRIVKYNKRTNQVTVRLDEEPPPWGKKTFNTPFQSYKFYKLYNV